MKKAMRKMIPAVIMLLISAMLVGTSTYAWFSMNKVVTVTGMSVKAKGSDDVLISLTNLDADSYVAGVNQQVNGRLRPVSTTTGLNDGFYWAKTTDINAEGQVRGGSTYTLYDANDHHDADDPNPAFDCDNEFNENYSISTPTYSNFVQAYADYSFYIKATNADGGAKNLRMSRCNILYNGAEVSTIKAWRVAVFAKEITNHTYNSTVSDEVATANRTTILALSGAQYFGDSTNHNDAVSATSTLSDVSNLGANANLGTLNAGDEKFYKVTVRLWLEGEDSTCKNTTFANLDADWTLDLIFDLSTDNGVNTIGSAATITVTKSNSDKTATAALNITGETAATYQWFEVASNGTVTPLNNSPVPASTSGADSYSNTDNATKDVYCVITTEKGSVYRSAVQQLAAANS